MSRFRLLACLALLLPAGAVSAAAAGGGTSLGGAACAIVFDDVPAHTADTCMWTSPVMVDSLTVNVVDGGVEGYVVCPRLFERFRFDGTGNFNVNGQAGGGECAVHMMSLRDATTAQLVAN